MSLTLFTVLSVVSLFLFRRKRADWQKLRAVDFAYPLVPASYTLVGTCMIFYGVISQPKASLSVLGTICIGVVVYKLSKRTHPFLP